MGCDTGPTIPLKAEELGQGVRPAILVPLRGKGHPFSCDISQHRDPPRCNMACWYRVSAIDSIIFCIAKRSRHSAGIALTP